MISPPLKKQATVFLRKKDDLRAIGHRSGDNNKPGPSAAADVGIQNRRQKNKL